MKNTYEAIGTATVVGVTHKFSTRYYQSGIFCYDTAEHKLKERVAKANFITTGDVSIESIKEIAE